MPGAGLPTRRNLSFSTCARSGSLKFLEICGGGQQYLLPSVLLVNFVKRHVITSGEETHSSRPLTPSVLIPCIRSPLSMLAISLWMGLSLAHLVRKTHTLFSHFCSRHQTSCDNIA